MKSVNEQVAMAGARSSIQVGPSGRCCGTLEGQSSRIYPPLLSAAVEGCSWGHGLQPAPGTRRKKALTESEGRGTSRGPSTDRWAQGQGATAPATMEQTSSCTVHALAGVGGQAIFTPKTALKVCCETSSHVAPSISPGE